MRLYSERGFIGTLLIIFLALVALKYFFGFSIFGWASSEQGRAALAYFWQMVAWLKHIILALWAYIH